MPSRQVSGKGRPQTFTRGGQNFPGGARRGALALKHQIDTSFLEKSQKHTISPGQGGGFAVPCGRPRFRGLTLIHLPQTAWCDWRMEAGEVQAGVNFINITLMNFSYERCFL